MVCAFSGDSCNPGLKKHWAGHPAYQRISVGGMRRFGAWGLIGVPILLLFPAPLGARISSVQVTGVTATQAVLTYVVDNAPPPPRARTLRPNQRGPADCTVELSESASFAPLVPDVNPALFPGADRDTRPGSISAGSERLIVLGKRAAEIAADGRRHSRALQAATTHYYRITCGSDRATGSFATANIPLGNTYGEAPPADRDHPGQYAWPEMPWNDFAPRIIDPFTGLLYKPLTRPNLSGPKAANQPFSTAVDLGGAGEWSNPAGAVGSDSPATYSGGNQSWLYLKIDGFSIYPGASWQAIYYSLNYFQVHWNAWGDPVDVCLTVNGVSCASAIRQVILPSAPAEMTIGTQNPNLDFWTDAAHIVSRPDAVYRSGSVAVSASGLVTYLSGDVFDPGWAAGSHIAIGKSECRIARLVHNQQLTIDSAACEPALAVPVKSAPYTAGNFGVLVRKSKPGSGSVSIQSAVYHYGTAYEPVWPAGAHTLFCADAKVSDPGDVSQYGYHCYVYGAYYWINPSTAEARLLGVPSFLNTTVGGDHVEGCSIDAAAFDPANVNRFFCLSHVNQLPVILRGEYTGDHHGLGAVDLTSAQIQATWTNLTPVSQGRDLLTLIHQFDADFDAALFGSCFARGATADAKIVVTCLRGGQDSLGWEILFDTASVNVLAAYKSWDHPPGRWCKIHNSAPVIGSDSWMRVEFASNSDGTDAGFGAWQTQITSGPVSAQTLQACPGNPFGASGNRCTTVTVQGEPCDFTPAASEPHNCPYNPNATFLMETQPGDFFQIDQEWVRLIAKQENQWVLQRDYLNLGITGHSGGSNLVAACSANPFGDTTLWNFREDPHGSDANGNTIVVDLTSTSHGSVTKEGIQGTANWRVCAPGANGSCLSARTGSDVRDWLSRPATVLPWSAPTFAGQPGNFLVESYSSFPPTSPVAPDRSWFLYNRPFTPNSTLNQLTRVSGDLYKVAAPALHRKTLPAMALCGMHPLVDVSGPQSVIGGSSTDAYRYCVAENAGECSTGSSAGAIYVNCPAVGVPPQAACSGTAEDHGVCVADNGSYTHALVQVSNRLRNANGQGARVLGSQFRPYQAADPYWSSRVLPDGLWAILWSPWFNWQRSEIFLAKLPPFPAPDHVDRSSFEPISLYLSGVQGATGALVEFGYAENGDAGRFYCTSRQETCVRGDQSGNDYAFAFESVDPIACHNGCTATVPAIPQRVLYYRVRYLDDSGHTVATSASGAMAIP